MADEAFEKAWSEAVDEPLSGVCLARVYDRHEIGYVLGDHLYVRGVRMRYDLHRSDVKAFREDLFGKVWI